MSNAAKCIVLPCYTIPDSIMFYNFITLLYRANLFIRDVVYVILQFAVQTGMLSVAKL